MKAFIIIYYYIEDEKYKVFFFIKHNIINKLINQKYLNFIEDKTNINLFLYYLSIDSN